MTGSPAPDSKTPPLDPQGSSGCRDPGGRVLRGATRLDRRIRRLHHHLIHRARLPVSLVTLGIYALAFIALGPRWGVSANYLVLLPVMGFALAFGLWGGLVAGVLALPANLLFYLMLKRMDAAPESWVAAELAGLAVGTLMGYLSDFFIRLEEEFELQHRTTNELRGLLADREILLQEVHHRVRNNLATISSLVRLQLERNSDSGFQDAGRQLALRIQAISLVHDQLFQDGTISRVDIPTYLGELARLLVKGASDHRAQGVGLVLDTKDAANIAMGLDNAVSLGLVCNEILTNSFKHARAPGGLTVGIGLHLKNHTLVLEVWDNGQGFPEAPLADKPRDLPPSLGLTLIQALAAGLDARFQIPQAGQSCWTLEIPLPQG